MTSVLNTFFETFDRKLEEPVREHLKNVYACVTLSALAAAIGSILHILTEFQSGLFTTIASIALFFALSATPDNGKNVRLRLGYLMGFTFFTGMGLGPMLEYAIHVNPSIIVTALVGTCVVFISFSLCAIFAERGKWLYLGGILMSVLSTMLITSLANMFFLQSQAIAQAQMYIGLAVMCAFVLYDTQLIIEKRRLGNKDFIAHALDLFVDFVGIFRRLLILLAQREESENQRRRKQSS